MLKLILFPSPDQTHVTDLCSDKNIFLEKHKNRSIKQSNCSLFLEKPFYLRTDLKKYSIYNITSKIDKKFEINFLKFKFKE